VSVPANALLVVAAAAALVVLTFVVGLAMLRSRVSEMRRRRIHPQSVATASQMAARLENVQASDNFRNLFETPVLFYALVAVAVGVGWVPGWLALGAWVYVLLRLVHSAIHCSYNRVLHRLAAFALGFGLLVAMWLGYVIALVGRSAA
jgi:hypothetical protein